MCGGPDIRSKAGQGHDSAHALGRRGNLVPFPPQRPRTRRSVAMVRRIVTVRAALVIMDAATARAEVTRVTVSSRADIGFAGYEKIVGRVFFAVDPADPRNAIVVDLDKAPRMADGRVEFSSDFTIVRPKSGGNGVAIVDIVNRGRATVIPNFNRSEERRVGTV